MYSQEDADKFLEKLEEIKQNPPDSSDDSDSDSSDSVPSPASLPVASAPSQPMPDNGQASLVDSTPAAPAPIDVKNYIANRLAGQNQGLQDAQAQANQNRGFANIAEGLGQTVAGIARSNTYNPASYAYLHNQADQPVADFLAKQKIQEDNLKQVASENAVQRQMQLEDPSSVQSVMTRKLIGSQLEKYGIDSDSIEGASSADLKDLQKTLDGMETRASREDIIKLKQQALQLQRDALNASKASKDDIKADDQFKGSLSKNEAYKEADTSANTADALISTVKNATTNKTAAQSLPTELSNFASKGKRLHAATIEAFTHPNSDLMTRIEQGINKSSEGTIPQDVANDIVGYLNLEKQAANIQKNQVVKNEAEDFKKINGRYPKLYSPEQTPSQPSQSQSISDRVNVISPNGKRGTIPASQLQDALSQGYRQE